MPGVVPDGMIELSGFAVGAGEKSELIDPTTISIGDAVIGYPSDGFHANGWSLIRKILAAFPDEVTKDELPGLLAPTRLYHDVVNALKTSQVTVRAMAHITGGGLTENLERLLAEKVPPLKFPVGNWKPFQKFFAMSTTKRRSIPSTWAGDGSPSFRLMTAKKRLMPIPERRLSVK